MRRGRRSRCLRRRIGIDRLAIRAREIERQRKKDEAAAAKAKKRSGVRHDTSNEAPESASPSLDDANVELPPTSSDV